MNDLISKSGLLTSLIHCKKLTLEGFEEVREHIENYPINKVECEMFTKDEKTILLQLICNEQIKHHVVKDKYNTDEYVFLEQLKSKIRDM